MLHFGFSFVLSGLSGCSPWWPWESCVKLCQMWIQWDCLPVIKGVWLLELLEQGQWLVTFWPPSRQWRLINHMPRFSLQREYKLVVSLCYCEGSEKLNLTCGFKSFQLACSKSQLVHVTWCLKCIMSREIVHCYPLFSGEMGIVALRFWVNLHEINL